MGRSRFSDSSHTTSSHPGSPEQEKKEDDPHCYFSAVEFPKGYNWKRDSAGGQVNCRIVLFRDGERKLELPVQEGGLSADPDMHRIAGGHLYTDYCTDGETVIGRDGEELFRYPGRESMRGFFVDAEGRIHTLGQNRSGQGFSYRINGEAIYFRDAGILFGGSGAGPGLRSGALCQDSEGHVCFTFATGSGHWWIWQGGTVREIPLEDAQSVFDLRPVRGSPVAAYKKNGLRIKAGEPFQESYPTDLTVLSARIIPDGNGKDQFRIAVRLRTRDGSIRDAWMNTQKIERSYTEYDGGMEHVLLDGQDCFVGKGSEGKVVAIRQKDSEAVKLETGRYLLISPSCIWMDETDALIALSGDPDVGAGPQIWHNGEMLSILMNGYLTGISFE